MELTKKIEYDITSHLSSGNTPCKLTVAALASHYGVSQTPVRTVITKLIEGGKLIKLSNGRLQAPDAFDFTSDSPWQPASGPTTDPYEAILREIVQKSLLAEETFLREERTATHHKLSRSGVREICHLIAGQGLLEHIPRRGWKIRHFTHADLQAYLDTREVLELKALDLAWERLDDTELQAMYDGNIPAKNAQDFPVIDDRIHSYIIEKSGNFYILDFFNRHAPFFRILFEWEGKNREAAVEAVQQHREILTAIINRDRKQAAKALSHHILCNHPVLDRIGTSQ
ncbi:MAG: GntR family transcriptional regulator [Planctomycetaceae bacterium]|nr:GntR family transcriptional regulator [Planctomycetaceae bacterium]